MSLTLVGEQRVSIGPPIIVSVLGVQGWLSRFMIAVAAKTGTDGWQTAMTCAPSPICSRKPMT